MEAKGEKSRPAPKRLPKRARSATHRADRADIRAEVKEERAAMGGRKKPKPAKPPKPTKSKRPAAAPLTIEEAFGGPASEADRPTEPSIPTAQAGKGKRSHAGLGMTALESAREFQGLRVTKGKQLRARTTAIQDRLQAAGKRRIQMHASARGRRRQGKRDAR